MTENLVTQEETMLNAPTIEQLHALKLAAMATAWTEQQQQADMTALAFDERFALLVEAEWRSRENKRLARALQAAKLKLSHPCLEAIDSLAPLQDQDRSDVLAILDDRYATRSTIITSQLPPAQWHDYIGEPTLADAICDRLLHNAHRIVLKGPSRRKEDKLDS